MILMFGILMSIAAVIEELPEPTMPPITYEFQIAWGTKTMPQEWLPITAKSITVTSGVAAAQDMHNYYGKIGDNTIEFASCDSTPENPIKVDAVIAITDIPKQKPFDYCRVKVRGTMALNGQTITSEWSDQSFWISVAKPKNPSVPVNK